MDQKSKITHGVQERYSHQWEHTCYNMPPHIKFMNTSNSIYIRRKTCIYNYYIWVELNSIILNCNSYKRERKTKKKIQEFWQGLKYRPLLVAEPCLLLSLPTLAFSGSSRSAQMNEVTSKWRTFFWEFAEFLRVARKMDWFG